MNRAFGIAIALLLIASPVWAQFDRLLEGLGIGRQSGLSDVKIGSGLKEALKVGTENTVNLTGRTDGYFQNKAIKILMPKTLQKLEKPLRLVGYGSQIDEFVLSMNRAAEKAAPFAKEIFWDAIVQMTFDDARKILGGSDTAATDYFKEKTSGKLARSRTCASRSVAVSIPVGSTISPTSVFMAPAAPSAAARWPIFRSCWEENGRKTPAPMGWRLALFQPSGYRRPWIALPNAI